jgi:hypothetical protein
MTKAAVRLGIAITTYNRRDMLLAQIDALRALTGRPFELVVCDDGSSDGTVAAVRDRGIVVLGGVHRGIAWNKNRGLFYLREIVGSDVILLLDDDMLPLREMWQREWIEAVGRHGHINYLPRDLLISGGNLPDDPGVSDKLWGPCVAFSRAALGYVGYFDTRFAGYGHEHTELTKRAIRAGFGGFIQVEDGRREHRFYSIEGGLKLLPLQPSASHMDAASAARNLEIMTALEQEPIFRAAWRSDAEYEDLRTEMAAVDGFEMLAPYQKTVVIVPAGTSLLAAPLGLVNIARGKPATQSSISQWSRWPTPEADAAGAVDGKPDGGFKFHTAMELDPWWRVDLGRPSEISEIRVFNRVDDKVMGRIRKLTIAVSNDDVFWRDVARKTDDSVVGGIDGAPFVWRTRGKVIARYVRVLVPGRGVLHLDQVEVYGPGVATAPASVPALPPAAAELATPQPAAPAVVRPGDPPDQELFSKFLSLGDNCEFGILQTKTGVDQLDLLRFGGTGKNEAGLILAMKERFSRFGTPEDLEVPLHGDEWVSISRGYDIVFHTHRHPPEVDGQTIYEEEAKRLKFLARKLVRDLEAGEKIFVRKTNKVVADSVMMELYRAMRDYGSPTLLWVTAIDSRHPRPGVERLAPGLLRGYIRRLAPYENAMDVRVEDWREICRVALRLNPV